MTDASAAIKEKEKEKEVDVMVLNYLKKRGYRQAEASFKQEANLLQHPAASLPLDQLASNASLDHDVSIANYIMFYNSGESSSPQRYIESYVKLREWIHSSLDLYKQEMLVILYPVFVHCYLDLISKGHSDEAHKLMDQLASDHTEFHEDELKWYNYSSACKRERIGTDVSEQQIQRHAQRVLVRPAPQLPPRFPFYAPLVNC